MAPVAVRAWEEAVRTAGLEPPERLRPGPLVWYKYAGWGRLPARYNGWILYDTTCSTWVLRHLARLVALAVPPVAAIAVLLPTSGGIRALTAVTVGLCAVLFAGIYGNEGTDHRLVQAGFPAELGAHIRDARATHGQRLANAMRRERAAVRRHPRG